MSRIWVDGTFASYESYPNEDEHACYNTTLTVQPRDGHDIRVIGMTQTAASDGLLVLERGAES